MTISPINLQGLNGAMSSQLLNVVQLKRITVPSTTINNRAQMVDPSQDLLPRFGVNRVIIEQYEEVQTESGSANQKVYKPINDTMDQMRLVGNWLFSLNGPAGSYAQPNADATAYLEISFYGTGLNVLGIIGNATYAAVAAVDGGAEGSNFWIQTNYTGLNGRNYPTNQSMLCVRGLTLGNHTVRIRNTDTTNGIPFYGYEVLNENTTLQYPLGSSFSGAAKLSNTTLTTDTYNSNFVSGTLGSTGGHVVVYHNSTGTVLKSVTPAGTPAYLSSASHANESVIASYKPRQFGAGRGANGTPDDYSLDGNTARVRAFVLDDDSTTLNGGNNRFIFNDALGVTTTSDYIQFAFIGTGLDIIFQMDSANTASWTLSIDGVTQGTITPPGTGQGLGVWQKICSGLPYGTHTVRLVLATAGNFPIERMVVYGPTKPTVPSGCVELCDYYILGNYSIASYNSGVADTSQGVIRKANTREMAYNGTWSINGPTNDLGGWQAATSTNNDYVQYTFYGTGFELRYSATTVAGTMQLTVDGSTNFTTSNTSPTGGAGWTAALTTGSYGALGSFTASTGTIVTNTDNLNAKAVSVTGLTLGVHTIKLQKISGSTSMVFLGFDIVTPIHSPKANIPGDISSTLLVGNNAIGDSRNFGAATITALKNWDQAVGVSSGPSTTSTSLIPMPDLTCVIKTSGNPIDIFYEASCFHSVANATALLQVYMDGVAVSPGSSMTSATANAQGVMSESLTVPASAGTHVVQVFWAANSGATLSNAVTRRILTVKER